MPSAQIHRDLLAIWWAAATAPRLWPVLTAAAISAAMGLALSVAATRPIDLAELPLDQALRHSRDDYRYVAHRTLNLAASPPSKPTLYLLGGSSIRESIHDPASLEERLLDRTGQDWRVEILAHSNQSMGQSLAIIDNLPADSGIVLVGYSPNRFTRDPGRDLIQASCSRCRSPRPPWPMHWAWTSRPTRPWRIGGRSGT